MRLSGIILLLLIGIFFAQIVYYYPSLPETIATHFDGSGTANGWMSKSGFLVFESVFLLFIIFEFKLLPYLLEKAPDSLINLPNKNYWLSAERRVETFAALKNYFEWFSIGLLALFIAINQMIFRANLSCGNLSGSMMWLIIALFLLFTVVWTISLVRKFKKT